MKLARNHGVEELLPFTVKGTEYRLQKRLEHGLRVKGTGVGQQVKGKMWERTLKGRYVEISSSIGWNLSLIEFNAGWRREDKLCWRCHR